MHSFGVLIQIRAGHEQEAAEHLRQLTHATRQEPGNRLYLGHQLTDDPTKFYIYERYESAADHQAHRATEHYRRHATEGLLRLAESRTSVLYTAIE